ncbi:MULTISPECIES: hypothetical protein [Streptomyces albovinaceus subgroup]|uniref:Lipoprotein n=1 Tax=Streptomyces albus TaxID=1888 RepID=A0A8H1LJC0_9ACTN|nr:hypothetical protein [Streptomyces mediolani]TGG86910.1 hypothetical protein D8771_05415 [Streptomyces albus]
MRKCIAMLVLAGVVALTGCDGQGGTGSPQSDKAPPLASQQGKPFKEAALTAKAAGYATRLDTGAGGRDYSSLDDPEGEWTVCWHETERVKGDETTDGDFWSVLFYMVEDPTDCESGKLTPDAERRYRDISQDGVSATEGADDGGSDFARDTGLPDPQERNPDGSYKYSLCEGSDLATADDCYPYMDEYEKYLEDHE